MRVVVQRVKEASVSTGGELVNSIRHGILIFLGISKLDTPQAAQYLAERCANLRIFEDEYGKMNLSVKHKSGSALVISQFTLYADTRKGNRPSFIDAATPDIAEPLYEEFVRFLRDEMGERKVCTGAFRAMMDIALINDGPVTILLESK
jgi:D-tyrosyl-tRNA(Tyr) deacylase